MASMKLSKACINLVKSYEGYHKKLPNGDCTTYYCPANVLTIGYGCTEGIMEGDVWTHAQAIEALRRELEKHETAVNRLVTAEISQNAFDALVSFSYNCGYGALSKSGLLKKTNKGDFAGAAAEFHKWNKGGGKVLPGLVRRRAQEAELFLTPDASTEPAMAQAVDAPPTKLAQMSDMLKFSRTIGGLLSMVFGGIVYIFRETVDLFLKAAEQIELLSPAMKVLTGLGVAAAAVGIIIAVAGLCLAFFAKTHDTVTGKVLK
jgi:lysozyme